MTQGPNNVIGFRSSTSGSLSALQQRCIEALRETSQRNFDPLLNELFDKIDDAFFGYSERAVNTDSQLRFFEAMREIRRHRQPCVQTFYSDLMQRLTDFTAGTLKPALKEVAGSTSELSLVEDEQLERQLAVNSMIDRWNMKYQQALFALGQRLSKLMHRESIDDALNPFSTGHVVGAFKLGLEAIELPIEIILIMLKHFERHVMSRLDGLYLELNEQLARLGVLPELRYAIPRYTVPGGGGGGGGGVAAGAGAIDPAAVAEAKAAALQPGEIPGMGPVGQMVPGVATRGMPVQPSMGDVDPTLARLVSELSGLLTAQRGGGVGGVAGPAGMGATGGGMPATGRMGPPVAVSDLVNAIALLQSDAHGQIESGEYRPAAARELKSSLLDQVGRLGLSASPQTALGGEESSIDLVGMMFEYALQDRNIPAPIQALLGRLQIPYLKVALLDKQFVARKNHPARKLLDVLAHACVGWTEEGDRDRKLYDKVHEIVITVMRDFHEDVTLFERLVLDFEDFSERNKKRIEIAERRATETARGKEKLDTAQRRTAHEIVRRLRERAVPAFLEDVIRRHWSAYMVLTQLRHGEDSPEWQRSIEVVDHLTLHGAEGAVHNPGWLRSIEPELRKGFQAIGLQSNHVDEILKHMGDRLSAATRHDPQTAMRMPAPPPMPTPTAGANIIDLDRFVDEERDEQQAIASDPSVSAAVTAVQAGADEEAIERSLRETWLETVRSLKPGTWLEFIRDDGGRDRAKLLWVSATRLRYLFVNRAGVKVAEKDAKDLAEDFAEERASVLEETPLVDRALQAILDRLRGPSK